MSARVRDASIMERVRHDGRQGGDPGPVRLAAPSAGRPIDDRQVEDAILRLRRRLSLQP